MFCWAADKQPEALHADVFSHGLRTTTMRRMLTFPLLALVFLQGNPLRHHQEAQVQGVDQSTVLEIPLLERRQHRDLSLMRPSTNYGSGIGHHYSL